jgi:hypothetical protein
MVLDPGTADPATITVDCISVNINTDLPNRSFLEVAISQPEATGKWDVFLKRGPDPIPGWPGLSRYRFDDYRHVFRDTIMPTSFNIRDAEGQVSSGSEKTIDELWQEIATATGATIYVASKPTEFKVPAAWADRTATECANSLLQYTGSRMFYDPANQRLTIGWAGDETDINVNQRFAVPISSTIFTKLDVFSNPTLYDAKVKCRAIWEDDNGDAEPMADLEDEDSLKHAFLGFPDVEDDFRRNRLVQAAFRLWQPVSVEYPEELDFPDDIAIKNHRGVVIGGSPEIPVYESIKVFEDTVNQVCLGGRPEDRMPDYHRDAGLITNTSAIVVCDKDGEIQTDVDFVAAYHVREDGYPNRLKSIKVSKTLHSTLVNPVTKQVVVPAVRPIDSDMDDGPDTGDWEALLDDITDAIEPMMGGKPQRVDLPGWRLPANWGRTSAVRWYMQLNSPSAMTTRFVLDNPPSGSLTVIGGQS